MEFRLKGDVFELTPALVRERLLGQIPQEVRTHWVEVNGVRWPVKQVIHLVTGATKDRFQSQSASGWLRRLGFSVGLDSGTGDRVRSRESAGLDKAALEASELPEIETVEVHVQFCWRLAGSVTLDSEGVPQFPTLPQVPGLYRFDFGLAPDGVRTVYIGESKNLARRASNYRNARTDRSRQRTSRRVHKEVVAHLASKGSIEFVIATSVVWGGGDELDLRRTSGRRLAENAAVALAQVKPATRVLNIDIDLAGL